MEGVKEKFPGLTHNRIPVCNSAAPLEADFDTIVQALLGTNVNAPVIVNCQVSIALEFLRYYDIGALESTDNHVRVCLRVGGQVADREFYKGLTLSSTRTAPAGQILTSLSWLYSAPMLSSSTPRLVKKQCNLG